MQLLRRLSLFANNCAIVEQYIFIFSDMNRLYERLKTRRTVPIIPLTKDVYQTATSLEQFIEKIEPEISAEYPMYIVSFCLS